MAPGTGTRREGPSAEDKLTALHAQLMSAVEALASSDEWMQMLRAAARFPTYSPSNVLLINLTVQRPPDQRPTLYGDPRRRVSGLDPPRAARGEG